MDRRTDQELLSAFSRDRADAVFAELLRRHVDLVYSAALRLMGDAHRAHDVTQGTFVALAEQAGGLAKHPVLAGWLHRTARNIATQTIRAEGRRRAREQEAAAMNALNAGNTDPAWEEIAPRLDAALDSLQESDRAALLLRYFQRQSAREMAHTLGVSAEAAQKRVNRAVDRLRHVLAKQGLAVGATGLMGLLSTHAVQAAPAGIAPAIAASVTAVPAVATATTTTILGTLAMTSLTKTLLATAAVVTLIAAAGTSAFVAYRLMSSPAPDDAAASGQIVPVDSAAETFHFQAGQHLNGPEAPPIAGRAITLTAVFDARGQEGVIVAQGGLAHGFALYIQGGELSFALRRNNALTIATAGPVGDGRHTAAASLSAEGGLRVALDEQPPGLAKAAGVITMAPTDGLDVGADNGAPVGPYEAGQPFGGTIESVTLHLHH